MMFFFQIEEVLDFLASANEKYICYIKVSMVVILFIFYIQKCPKLAVRCYTVCVLLIQRFTSSLFHYFASPVSSYRVTFSAYAGVFTLCNTTVLNRIGE